MYHLLRLNKRFDDVGVFIFDFFVFDVYLISKKSSIEMAIFRVIGDKKNRAGLKIWTSVRF